MADIQPAPSLPAARLAYGVRNRLPAATALQRRAPVHTSTSGCLRGIAWRRVGDSIVGEPEGWDFAPRCHRLAVEVGRPTIRTFGPLLPRAADRDHKALRGLAARDWALATATDTLSRARRGRGISIPLIGADSGA